MVRGSHTLTFGTHNEFFKFRNLFIRENFGNYEFASLDTFEAGSAQLFDYSFSLTGDPQFAGRIHRLPVRLLRRRSVARASEFHADVRHPLGQAVLPGHADSQSCGRRHLRLRNRRRPGDLDAGHPASGFNWDLTNEMTRQQMRGGIGIFGGRTPYRVAVEPVREHRHRIPAPSGLALRCHQQHSVRAGSRQTANERRTVPRRTRSTSSILTTTSRRSSAATWRTTAAFPFGLTGTVELLFANDVKDIDYDNLNLVQTATREDGRPVLVRTCEPHVRRRHPAAPTPQRARAGASRPRWTSNSAAGGSSSGSYLYGQAEVDQRRHEQQARSTWINVYTAWRHQQPTAGGLELRRRSPHRPDRVVYLHASRNVGVTLSMFYNGQTGSPTRTTSAAT